MEIYRIFFCCSPFQYKLSTFFFLDDIIIFYETDYLCNSDCVGLCEYEWLGRKVIIPNNVFVI